MRQEFNWKRWSFIKVDAKAIYKDHVSGKEAEVIILPIKPFGGYEAFGAMWRPDGDDKIFVMVKFPTADWCGNFCRTVRAMDLHEIVTVDSK